MTRAPLPARRECETVTQVWHNTVLDIGIGFYNDGRPGEVFATGALVGSDMAHLIADACVVVSIALQHGAEPAALAHSLGTVPAFPGNGAVEPASPIGVIVAALAEAGG